MTQFASNLLAPTPLTLKQSLARCPTYAPTPLRQLSELATSLGIKQLYVKDESQRMDLGSFKALGGAYAIACIAENLLAEAGLDVADIKTPHAAAMLEKQTVCCASAGNHGLSVAAGAKVFGMKAVIFLSNSVPATFQERLKAMGADVQVVDGSYDDSLHIAEATAKEYGWHLVSDTSSVGYTEIPIMIMQGYGILLEEAIDEINRQAPPATHIFVQAGVGGLAASVACHIRHYWGTKPKIIVVEPDKAPCLTVSIQKQRMTRVDGGVSNQGRLDCKEPSLIAFELLRQYADHFMTVSDDEAISAVQQLSSQKLDTTPSGAAGLAGLVKACKDMKLRENLGLDNQSHVLIFMTEGPEFDD